MAHNSNIRLLIHYLKILFIKFVRLKILNVLMESYINVEHMKNITGNQYKIIMFR